jgi:type I restriction enzyme S subunit
MVPYLRAANVNDGSLDLSDVKSMNFSPSEQEVFALRAGDVLVSEGSGSLTAVGASAVWNGEVLGRVCFQNTLLRLRPREATTDPRFLAWWARAAYVNGLFASIATGANIYHLSAERVRSLPIELPPRDEQRRIADFLDAEIGRIDQMVALRSHQLELIRERNYVALSSLATTGGESVLRPTGNHWIPVCAHDWSIVPLKRRWRVIDCKHRTPAYVPTGYPVVSPGDISPGRLDLSRATRFVEEADFLDLADEERRPMLGDIVYSRNASIGIAAYVDTTDPFTMGQDVCRITSEDQSQLFLAYFLNTVALAELRALQVGSTFSRINIAMLLNLSIACPPVYKQHEVASRMDAVAGEHERVEQVVRRQSELLLERRQAMITAAVTGQFDVTTARGADLS